MVTPNEERDIWARFRPAVQQAGGTLGQAFGQFAQLPGVRHVLGGLSAVQERGVNPFVSQVIAGLPLAKGDRRWESFRTPSGGLSPRAVIEQATPIALPAMLAKGAMGVARENIPALRNLRLAPQDTIKAQRLRAEETRREASLGRDLTGTELRMMEQEMYALPKHMRGALQEAPWFFLPSAGAAKAGLSATRAGISGAGKLGRAAPLARGGLRVAETALTPVEIAERATAKVITSPFKAARTAGRAVTTPIARATRPARLGAARALDPDMGKGREFQRIGGQKEAEVLRELGDPTRPVSDPQFSVDHAKLRYVADEAGETFVGTNVGKTRIKEVYGSDQIRNDARRIYEINPDIDIDDAFQLSDAKFYAPVKRWTSPEERGIVKDMFRKDQLTPKQIFDDEFIFHKYKKLGKENFGYNSARRFRDMLGKTKSGPVDNAVHEVNKLVERAGFGNVANKMGAKGDGRLDKVFRGLAKRMPTADSYVKFKMKLHDQGEVYRVMADSGARAQTLFSENWLAQRYVTPAARLPRILGHHAIEGTNEYKNFKDTSDALLQSAGVTTHEGELMVMANRIDELIEVLPEREIQEILPKYFDEFNAKLKGLDPDMEAYRVNSKGEVLSPHYQKMTLEMISQRKGKRVELDAYGNKVKGFDNFDGPESSGFYRTAGRTDASGRTANYTREQYDALVQYAEDVRDLYRKQRKKMLDSGLISQSEYEALGKYKWYSPIHFPAQRDLGNELAEKIISGNAGSGKGLNVLDNGIYNLVRDTSAATMEARGWLPVTGHSMLYDLINIEQRIGKNNATSEFVELILGRGQANLKDVSDDYIRFKVRIKDKKGKFSYRNMTRTELQTYRSYKQWGSDYRGRSPRTGTKGDVVDTRTPVSEVLLKIPYDDDLASGYFSFYKEGRRFVFGNSEGKPVPKILWDSINSRAGLANRSEKERYAMWKASNGFFRSVYTQQNPLFMVRNSFIDSLTVQLNAGVGMHKSAANIINNLKDIRAMEDAWIDIYNRTGPVAMKGGWNENKVVQEIQRKAKEANQNPTFIDWNQVKLANKVLRSNGLDKLKRFIPALGSATEMGPRMAVFKKSISKTVGDKEGQRLADLKKTNPEQFRIEMDENWIPQFDANNNRIVDPSARNVGFRDSIESQKAAQNATEATLDFSRGGELIRKWNEYILFMNPAFEGTKLPFRAVGFDLSPVVRSASRETKEAARAKAIRDGVEYVEPITEWGSWSDQARKYIRGGLGERGMTGMGFDVVSGGPHATITRLGMVAGTFWAIQMGHNKTQQYNGVPLYYDVPEYIRYNSMVFMLDADKDDAGDYIIDSKTGRPTPKYIVFPHRLREWNMFFQLGTFMDEYTDKTVPMDKSKFFEHYLTSASPIGIDPLSAFIPEALNVGVETLTGRDYYRDRDVVDEEYQRLPLDQQYNKYTSKTARGLAGLLDEIPGVPEPFDDVIGSPQRLEHLSENLFGQIGKEVLNLSDIVVDLFSDLINLEDKRPMKEKVKTYRDDMNTTERKEFLVSLTEKEYEEFEKELKEAETNAPLWHALKQSYYPERGGGISSLSRTLAQEQFKEVLDPDQIYKAGRQASKNRQRLKFRQDEDDEALANWRQDTAGRKLNPSEWRESHSTKWALYSHDLDKLADQYPKSIYAQSDEVKDAYYNAIYTAAGRLKDSRDAADLLLAGYYAIQVPKEDPDKTQWNDYFRTRDEYEQKVKGLSEATGDGLYEEFVRRREANNTETEKTYYASMKLTSIYWALGKSVDELYAGDLPRDAGYVAILQKQWDEYLNVGMPKKDALRKKSVTIRDMVKRRTELRKEFIKRDQALGMQKHGKPVSDIEAALVFWYGADYYRKPITAEANNLYRRLYLR